MFTAKQSHSSVQTLKLVSEFQVCLGNSMIQNKTLKFTTLIALLSERRLKSVGFFLTFYWHGKCGN